MFANRRLSAPNPIRRCSVGELGDKAEGTLKDEGGKLKGDKKMEWEGKAQKAKGDLEGAGKDMAGNEPATSEPIEGDKKL